MDTNCSICDEINGTPQSLFNDYDKIILSGRHILFSSRFFVILPSLGPLNDYHILIVPKTHCLSFASVQKEEFDEYLAVAEGVRTYNFDNYGCRTQFFEHGTGEIGCNNCSCISHAHMHAVATETDLLQRLISEYAFEPVAGAAFWGDTGNIRDGYTLYKNEAGIFINNKTLLPSQFLRQLFSTEDGFKNKLERWNWWAYPDINSVLNIINNYSALKNLML